MLIERVWKRCTLMLSRRGLQLVRYWIAIGSIPIVSGWRKRLVFAFSFFRDGFEVGSGSVDGDLLAIREQNERAICKRFATNT